MCNIKRHHSKNWHYFSKVNSSIFQSQQRLNVNASSNVTMTRRPKVSSVLLNTERSTSVLPEIKLKNTSQQCLDSIHGINSVSKMSQQRLSSEDLAFVVKTPTSRFKSRYDSRHQLSQSRAL